MDSAPEGGEGQPASVPPEEKVIYCGVCSLPPEYCEFGGTVQRCIEWLKEHHPAMHDELYSEEAITAATATLSIDAQKRAEKDSLKKAAKASAAASREEERRASSKVYIKRIERNKRKYVTAISGLELHGLDLKKVSKDLGKKFASGCSVTKTASGTDEIILQGDLSDDVFDFIVAKFPDVPEGNLECVEDKKKGKGGVVG